VFAKKEPSGAVVVALFNTGTSGNQTITVSWSQVGLGSNRATVTDLWAQRSGGTVTGSYTATLRPGETRLIRVMPASGAVVRYQAENGAFSTGTTVDTNHLNYTGTGFANTPNATGAWVEWTVTVASAGSRTVTVRYANGTTTDRPMDVSVNGAVVSAGRSFPGTGNWDTWAGSTLTVSLAAGSNTIRVTATTSGGAPNLDYLEIG
jgi:hypothetical protein